MNLRRQFQLTLYKLKKDFGAPISIIYATTSTVNLETGATTVDESSFKIAKAIVLGNKETRAAIYDLTFLAANKNFVYGGLFDKTTRVLVVDNRDLPSGYTPTLDHRCILEDERYQFKSIEKTVPSAGWLITCVKLGNQTTENVITIPVENRMDTSHGTSG